MKAVSKILRDVLRRFPRFKAFCKNIIQNILPFLWPSSHYVELADDEKSNEFTRLQSAWKNQTIPSRQRDLVDRQLEAYKRGERNINFDVMVEAINNLNVNHKQMRVLEIGCSSGYYSEVFDTAGLSVTYSGCDFSEAFIADAVRHYPGLSFSVEDATKLSYADNSFDLVISGCCLLHIPNYEVAVTETVRVASEYVVFHRTPVVLGQPNKYFRKLAYGVETVEIHFNEPEFLQLLEDNGLNLMSTYTLNEIVKGGQGSATRTYVCQKILK